MAQNASLEQLQACGFSDIASQLEFQRLVKEKLQADNSSGGDIDIVSLSPSQLTPICTSSYDSRADSSLSGRKPSRKIWAFLMQQFTRQSKLESCMFYFINYMY